MNWNLFTARVVSRFNLCCGRDHEAVYGAGSGSDGKWTRADLIPVRTWLVQWVSVTKRDGIYRPEKRVMKALAGLSYPEGQARS